MQRKICSKKILTGSRLSRYNLNMETDGTAVIRKKRKVKSKSKKRKIRNLTGLRIQTFK